MTQPTDTPLTAAELSKLEQRFSDARAEWDAVGYEKQEIGCYVTETEMRRLLATVRACPRCFICDGRGDAYGDTCPDCCGTGRMSQEQASKFRAEMLEWRKVWDKPVSAQEITHQYFEHTEWIRGQLEKTQKERAVLEQRVQKLERYAAELAVFCNSVRREQIEREVFG